MHLSRLILPFDNGVIWQVDFTGLPAGAGASLPRGLLFTRALNNQSTSETVQTSDSTLVTTGLTADVPRIGQRTSSQADRGLILEPNNGQTSWGGTTVPTNEGFSPASGGGNNYSSGVLVPIVTAGQPGPDGNSNASRVQLIGKNAYYTSGSSGSLGHVWAKATSGSATLSSGYPGGGLTYNNTLGGAWGRYEFGSPDATGLGYIVWYDEQSAVISGSTASNQDFVLDWRGQLSTTNGNYHMETIRGGATRPGERAYVASNSPLLDKNRLSMAFQFIPKGTVSQYAYTPYLFFINASNYARFSNVDGKVTVVLNGVGYTTAAGMSWARYDKIDLFLACGGGILNTVVKYRVNGGATVTLGTSSSAQANVPSATMDIGCSGITSELTAWHNVWTAYRAGRSPYWAI